MWLGLGNPRGWLALTGHHWPPFSKQVIQIAMKGEFKPISWVWLLCMLIYSYVSIPFWVMCLRLLGDEHQPSLPLSFHHVIFYCRHGVLDCKHWSIIRDIFSLHQVQVNVEWIPLFTYALSPFCWSCSGHHANYFGVSFVMVNLLYDFWYVATYNAVIYIYQVEISLFIKIMYSISPKNLIYHCMGENWWI